MSRQTNSPQCSSQMRSRFAVQLFAAENKIRAEAPGRSTFSVRLSDKRFFEDHGLKFREAKIADPEHVSSKTLSRLRLARNKM